MGLRILQVFAYLDEVIRVLRLHEFLRTMGATISILHDNILGVARSLRNGIGRVNELLLDILLELLRPGNYLNSFSFIVLICLCLGWFEVESIQFFSVDCVLLFLHFLLAVPLIYVVLSLHKIGIL